ncbi:MAG: hypothetical protein ACTSWQ_09915 [Candidatus Thorarchaeota archaeon]
MVDKIVNFFWGGAGLSWMRYMTLYSFRKLNPDWTMRLYVCDSELRRKSWSTPEVQDFFCYSGEDLIGKVDDLNIEIREWSLPGVVAGPQHKSNFFKWQLLANESGFYSDLDILYLKPMREYYEKMKGFDVAICFCSYFSIGFMASSGDNRFYRDVFNYTFKSYNPKVYQSAGVISLCNMLREKRGQQRTKSELWDVLVGCYPNVQIYNNSMALLYHWSSTHVKKVFEELHTKVPNESIGIHWYAGHPVAQKYNNLLSGSNFRNYKNTFCHFAEEVLG